MEEDFGGFGSLSNDPEAGIPSSGGYSGGAVEKRGQGTGEGYPQDRNQRMRYYERVGNALQRQGPPEMVGAGGGGGSSGSDDLGISNFNKNWLADALSAGSANGAHL